MPCDREITISLASNLKCPDRSQRQHLTFRLTMSDLEVPFPYPDPKWNDYPLEEIMERSIRRYRFWDSPSTLEWFQARGYTLYERFSLDRKDRTKLHPSLTVPRMKSNWDSNGKYPYAFIGEYDRIQEAPDLPAYENMGVLAFAQDQQGRHVVIKLVPNESDELRIYELLRAQDIETLKEYCILPILDILTSTTHSFAVMPRWGSGPVFPMWATLSDVVEFIRAMLKGLAFLHKNLIVHRDMSTGNAVINQFSGHSNPHGKDIRHKLRRDGQALYALIDYNISMMVPPGMEPSEFRLPYVSWDGVYGVPDVAQGEPDYDPFAWDVGALGAVLCEFFQHVETSLYSHPCSTP
ncbi:other/AgaK1 protein kinase [Coprinopsis cinerea AmutBmut pab1-1]|nr:other/AgaK1 protein kinase [Coprinopsis cinerea AmutBmut pab1-1]